MHQSLSSDIEWTSKIILRQELLGSGSFGMIHKVVNTNTKNVAVLKETTRTRTNKEQFIWKSVVSHPYVVQLFASFFDENRVFYVFEYMPRGNIRSFLQVHKVLNSKVAKILTSQIVLAIKFLHGKNIFHRNISNKNIFLSSDGKAKLSNFQYSVMKKVSRGIHGHLFYQAPEVFSGHEYDLNSDWFSLGVCLYEMVVGRTPVELHCLRQGIDFEKLDFFGKIVVIITSTYYVPKIFSNELREVLKRFFSKDMKQRLGYNDDIESFKTNSFFKDIDWRSLENGKLAATLPTEDEDL